MTIRLNDKGQIITDFFGMKALTNLKSAMYGFSPKEGELDYLESEGEAGVFTALVFDAEETAALRRVALAAQQLADDQEAVNFSIKLVDLLDAMENYSPPSEGKALTKEEARELSAAGS